MVGVAFFIIVFIGVGVGVGAGAGAGAGGGTIFYIHGGCVVVWKGGGGGKGGVGGLGGLDWDGVSCEFGCGLTLSSLIQTLWVALMKML